MKIEDPKQWLESSKQKARAQVPMNNNNNNNSANQSNNNNGLSKDNNAKISRSVYQKRNYYALPPKYSESDEIIAPKNTSPPPLAPRLNPPANKKSFPPPPRPTAPHNNSVQG